MPRLRAPGVYPKDYSWGDPPVICPENFDQPLHWRKPRLVFVCPMSDFFYPGVSDCYRNSAWLHMELAREHTFLILTKRPELIPNWLRKDTTWPEHIRLGVTVESSAYEWRMEEALKVPTQHHFVSFEPLLGPISEAGLDALAGFDWVIIGAESGAVRRLCANEWVYDIASSAVPVGVPVFVKQVDLGVVTDEAGRLSKDPAEWPEGLRIQQFPAGVPVPKRGGCA